MKCQCIKFTGPEFLADHSIREVCLPNKDPADIKNPIYSHFTLLRGWLAANRPLCSRAIILWHQRQDILEIRLWSPQGETGVYTYIRLSHSLIRARRALFLRHAFEALENLALQYYAGMWGFTDGAKESGCRYTESEAEK